MYANMLCGLIEHGKIRTTERKARELRGVAEKAITRATALGDVLLKEPSNLEAEDGARLVHAMRMVRRTVRDRAAVVHLFREVAPRYLGRPGGYTRLCKLGFRRGDGARMALIEFVAAEMPERETPVADAEKKKPKKRGLLGRSKDDA